MATCQTKINQLNEKRLFIPWRVRVPIWKMNFCSKLFRPSVLLRISFSAANFCPPREGVETNRKERGRGKEREKFGEREGREGEEGGGGEGELIFLNSG